MMGGAVALSSRSKQGGTEPDMGGQVFHIGYCHQSGPHRTVAQWNPDLDCGDNERLRHRL